MNLKLEAAAASLVLPELEGQVAVGGLKAGSTIRLIVNVLGKDGKSLANYASKYSKTDAEGKCNLMCPNASTFAIVKEQNPHLQFIIQKRGARARRCQQVATLITPLDTLPGGQQRQFSLKLHTHLSSAQRDTLTYELDPEVSFAYSLHSDSSKVMRSSYSNMKAHITAHFP